MHLRLTRQLLAQLKQVTPDEAAYKFLTGTGMSPDVALEKILPSPLRSPTR